MEIMIWGNNLSLKAKKIRFRKKSQEMRSLLQKTIKVLELWVKTMSFVVFI
jgi:hypothetical protein